MKDFAAPQGLILVETPDDLGAFCDRSSAGAVWQRDAGAEMLDWLSGLNPEQLPKGRTVVRPGAVRGEAERMCIEAGTPDDPMRRAWLDDIAALSDMFAELTHAPWVRMRLDVITTNACRRFHVDAVTARLVCTYRGTGTQFGFGTRESDPVEIHTARTGSPVLLRGTLWPTEPACGLLHRSPPIEGTGEVRSVLVLDPVQHQGDVI